MNGYLSGTHIAKELRNLAVEFANCGSVETFNVNSLSGRVSAMVETLRKQAIINVDEAAVEIVAADALECNPLDSGTWHKGISIRTLRERYEGIAFNDAKSAVERAYPTVARNIAVMALTSLEAENAKVGYGLHERVNACDHRTTLDNLAAASEVPSF